MPNITSEEKDTSAAAIAASGLLELSTLASTQQLQEKYYNAARNILSSLCSPAYLAEGTNSSGILLHGVQNHPGGGGIDVSLIHADHYFLEALLRYQKLSR
jgi:unsaturated chondroitin disaccharide hydrolase